MDPVASNPIVCVGSSSIRRWERLTFDFNDYEIVQRGFGGSQLEDLNFWVDELVIDYNPRAVIIWSGTNDLSTGEPASEVFSDFTALMTTLQAQLPNTDVFYLGVTRTLGNGGTTVERDAFNAQAQAYMDDPSRPRLHFIDLPSAFYALNPPNDPAFTSLYVDGGHLNKLGYDFWTSLIRPEVEAVVAPNKVYTPNPDTLAIGESLLFDFGPNDGTNGDHTLSPDGNGNHWNNWRPITGGTPQVNAGEHVGDLVDTTGANTGIGLVLTAGFVTNGKLNGGLFSPQASLLGDLAVESATQDYFFSTGDDVFNEGNDDVGGGFMLTGLDPNGLYELAFFGSRNTSITRTTEFRVFGADESVAIHQTSGAGIGADGVYSGNDDEIAIASGVTPDAYGQLWVDMTVLEGGFAYLNAMRVTRVTAGVASSPTEAIVDAGGTLTFTADIRPSGPGTEYRWQRDGVDLQNTYRVSGADTDTLVISPAYASDNGVYRCTAVIAGQTLVTSEAIGGVRGTDGGVFDVNKDGAVDVNDVLDTTDAAAGQ
ncbi:MAG: hypothetical protein Tsb0013_03410 [Phycisphaerales bacterium]